MTDDTSQPKGPSAGGTWTLMPPSDTLAPPGVLSGKAGGEPGAELREVFGKASDEARLLADKARQLAAQHGPELTRRTAEAVTAMGSVAERSLHNARAAVRSNDPRRRRLIFFGVPAAAIVIAGLAWVLAKQAATTKADTMVAETVTKFGLAPFLSYKSVSASPFGSASLHDVTLRYGGTAIPIQQLEINNAEIGTDGLHELDMALDGVTVPLAALARLVNGRNNEVIWNLVGMGYTAPVVDLRLRYSVDPGSDTDALHLVVKSEEIGSVDLRVRLGGLSALSRLITTDTSNPPSALALMAAVQAAANMTFKGGETDIDDAPLMARIKQIPDEALPPGAATPSGAISPEARPASPELVSGLRRMVGEAKVDSSVEAMRDWTVNGGRLIIKSEPPSPVALLRTDPYNPGIPVPNEDIEPSELGLSVSN